MPQSIASLKAANAKLRLALLRSRQAHSRTRARLQADIEAADDALCTHIKNQVWRVLKPRWPRRPIMLKFVCSFRAFNRLRAPGAWRRYRPIRRAGGYRFCWLPRPVVGGPRPLFVRIQLPRFRVRAGSKLRQPTIYRRR